jgi:hypothetical protein
MFGYLLLAEEFEIRNEWLSKTAKIQIIFCGVDGVGGFMQWGRWLPVLWMDTCSVKLS